MAKGFFGDLFDFNRDGKLCRIIICAVVFEIAMEIFRNILRIVKKNSCYH